MQFFCIYFGCKETFLKDYNIEKVSLLFTGPMSNSFKWKVILDVLIYIF